MEELTRLGTCANCGAPLPETSTDELCADCRSRVADTPTVMSAPPAPGDVTRIGSVSSQAVSGTSSRPDAVTILSGPSESPGPRRPQDPHLQPEQIFGPYRIVKLLGRGGMGEVYEAEHIEHGRHVALKTLTRRFGGSEDRNRFLREGELAASINHPHTVYVYGSEDIGGVPVIAMELLPGGTLRDLVHARGPLPTGEAVDLVLQLIAGLNAAASAGILHRDVKPANCFVDHDGAVKIGDFGLSIASGGKDQRTGMFEGTPQFAPPEQIRGETLDVRADIYAVGATLFYLLTGKPPFEDQDITTLITRVKTEAPRSPRAMRDGVPERLGNIVTRCLGKTPAERPASYTALEDELRPFASAAPVPASLPLRAVAGIVDQALFTVVMMPLIMFMVFESVDFSATMLVGVVQSVLILMYFTLFEGISDASLGKRLFGLRLIRIDGQSAGLARAFGRALTFLGLPFLVNNVPTLLIGAEQLRSYAMQHPATGLGLAASHYIVLMAMFSTARRRNGFAALQDLVTGTRVVRRHARASYSATEFDMEPAPAPKGVRAIGPYEITGTLGTTGAGDVLVGFDPRLKRRVWIHRQPAGTPALPPELRDIGRSARLRWLAGRRTPSEAWDAYEALGGQPLMDVERPQPWVTVRRWVSDLTRESQKTSAGSSPHFSLDRVWITAGGGAAWLDFPAPILTPANESTTSISMSAGQWLRAVAIRGLGGKAGVWGEAKLPPTLPITARAFLDELIAKKTAKPEDVTARATALLSQRDVLSKGRRAGSIAMCLAVPVMMMLVGWLAGNAMRQIAAETPDTDAFAAALKHRADLASVTTPEAAAERENLDVYIAGRYRPRIDDPKIWKHPITGPKVMPYESLARSIVATHPQVTPEQIMTSMKALGPFMVEQDKAIKKQQKTGGVAPAAGSIFLLMAGFVMTIVFAVILAFAFRGGLLLRVFGLAVAGPSGARVSRFRALVRAVIAWSPVIVILVTMLSRERFLDEATVAKYPFTYAACIAAIILFIGGAIFAALHPRRGLQDYIARTWIVSS